MNEALEKVVEPGADGPSDTLTVERTSGRTFHLYHDDGDGTRVGHLEVGPDRVHARGTFASSASASARSASDDPVIEWSVPAALNGYKYSDAHRVMVSWEVAEVAVEIVHERRRDPRRRDFDGHDWRAIRRWTVTPTGSQEVFCDA